MFEKSHILVVDDNPQNVELLKALLHFNGYIVATAERGAQALEMLGQEKIDLILLDVMMPGMDGFEVTRRIRANEETRDIPIILITALRETEQKIMGLEAGCDDFISIPFDRNEVMARIRTLLKLRYYRSQFDEKLKFEKVLLMMQDGFLLCDANLNIMQSNVRGRDLLHIVNLTSGWQKGLADTFTFDHAGDLTSDLRLGNLDFELRPKGRSGEGARPIRFSSSVIRDTDAKTVNIVIMLSEARG